MDHRKVPTSAEVWAVIRARHKDLKPFSSYSAPDGDQFGNPSQAVMMTEYGLPNAPCALIGARTTWDVPRPGMCQCDRPNEATEYWLCVPVEDAP